MNYFIHMSGGKLKGELKCQKHRTFLAQMEEVRSTYSMTEEKLLALFQENKEPSTKRSGGGGKDHRKEKKGSSPSTPGKKSSKPSTPGLSSERSIVNRDHRADSNSTTTLSPGPQKHGPISPPATSATPSSKVEPALLALPPSIEMGPSVWSTPLQSRSDSITSPYIAPLTLPASATMHTPFSMGGPGPGSPHLSSAMDTLSPLPSSALTPRTLASLTIGPNAMNARRSIPFSPSGSFNSNGGAQASPSSSQRVTPTSSGKGPIQVSPSSSSNFVLLDISNSDDYHFGGPSASSFLLKYAPWLPAKEYSLGPTLLCCKGVTFPSSEEYVEEVTVHAWPQSLQAPSPQSPQLVDAHALNRELKTLRLLAKSHPMGIAKIVSRKALTVPSPGQTPFPGPYSAVLVEYSDIGYLDRFVQTHLAQNPQGFSLADLRSSAVMLTDAVLHCHRLQVSHRDIRPSTILVTRPFRFQRDLLLGQFSLKLTDFRLASLGNLYNSGPSGADLELDRYSAPEVRTAMRNTGLGFEQSGDVWGLGAVLHYLSTGSPLVASSRELQPPLIPTSPSNSGPAAEDREQQLFRQLLQRHQLHERSPVLYDLIERTIRPPGRRITTLLLRCHPLLWPLSSRRDFLLAFSHVPSADDPSSAPHASPSLEAFLEAFDKYAPQFVFGAQGWIQTMPPALLAMVRPVTLRTDQWWSGRGLLLAIRSHLINMEALHATVYPGVASPAIALAAYVREITEVCFPRLLALLFELGGSHGTWTWDGDEVSHRWR